MNCSGLRTAPSSAGLEAKLPDIAADNVQAALGSLIAHLAVFEDLDPKTFELVVGFLPSVRARMAAALLPRQRPPLVVSEDIEIIGPEGSIIAEDLRQFLLEVVAEPPRLRQDDEIFQKDLDRFLEALEELPSSLVHVLELTQEKRLKQAQDWAQGLKLVVSRTQPKQRRLEIVPRGNKWLSSGLDEQYGQVYDFLRPLPSNKHIFDTGISFLSRVEDLYSHYESDYRFLGANVIAIKTKPGQAIRYWEAKSKDHEALRDSIYRAFTALRLGVFHREENVLDHLVFEQFNPLSLACPKRASRSSSMADRCRPWRRFENRQPESCSGI